MSLTPPQIQLVKLAQRQTNTSDADYRLMLRNVASVDSARLLDNESFEDVMAFFEDKGFRKHGAAPDHYRNKVALRGTFAGARSVHKIRELVECSIYHAGLGGLCLRFSHDRTDQVTKLRPQESYALIEMLKSAKRREARSQKPEARSDEARPFQPSSFTLHPTPTPHGGDYCEPEPF